MASHQIFIQDEDTMMFAAYENRQNSFPYPLMGNTANIPQVLFNPTGNFIPMREPYYPVFSSGTPIVIILSLENQDRYYETGSSENSSPTNSTPSYITPDHSIGQRRNSYCPIHSAGGRMIPTIPPLYRPAGNANTFVRPRKPMLRMSSYQRQSNNVNYQSFPEENLNTFNGTRGHNITPHARYSLTIGIQNNSGYSNRREPMQRFPARQWHSLENRPRFSQEPVHNFYEPRNFTTVAGVQNNPVGNKRKGAKMDDLAENIQHLSCNDNEDSNRDINVGSASNNNPITSDGDPQGAESVAPGSENNSTMCSYDDPIANRAANLMRMAREAEAIKGSFETKNNV